MDEKDYEVVTLEQITVAGVTVRTDNSAEGFEKTKEHWGRFFKEGVADKISLKKHDAVYEVYFDYESDARGAYTLLLGAQVKPGADVQQGMSIHTLPGSRYAKVVVDGPNGVRAAWQSIWSRDDLARSYCGDFEIFRGDAVELYVALKDE
jgi:predicted transcriptional regulator YdeE